LSFIAIGLSLSLSLSLGYDYSDARALLRAMCDFVFVLGIVILKIILSNTNALSIYLQGKSVDVVSAKSTADMTVSVKTLSNLRTDNSFKTVWEMAEAIRQDIKNVIEGSDFTFKEARQPRKKQHQQSLVGETPDPTAPTPSTLEENHRMLTYFVCL